MDIKAVIGRLQKVSRYFKSCLKVGISENLSVYQTHKESVNMAIDMLNDMRCQKEEWLAEMEKQQGNYTPEIGIATPDNFYILGIRRGLEIAMKILKGNS